jgi:membrane-associated protease RseP (regulator of RpoE activity)
MTPIRGWTRETRLLVVTIVLSVSVLLALARLRFPGQEPRERLALPARPLQQIVERASFDDLTNAISRAADRIRPALTVVSLRRAGAASASTDLLDSLDPGPEAPHALALYTGNQRWVSIAPPRSTRTSTAPAGWSIAGSDPIRSLVVFAGPATDAPVLSTSRPTLPAFLVVAEPTAAGVSVRPMFVAAARGITDDRWRAAVWPLAADSANPGALVFSLEGAFVGAVTSSRAGLVLVPGDTVVDAAQHVERVRVPWSIGVHLQRLDADLATALGVAHGVAVTTVDPTGPAAGRLLTGDVIEAIDGSAVDEPDDVLLRVASSDPGTGVNLDAVRGGTRTVVHIAASDAAVATAPAKTPPDRSASASIGARFVASSRGSRVDQVDRDGPAARAGLSRGDEIWWIQGAPAASPAAIARRWRALAPGARIAIGVNPAEPRLVVLERP